VASGLPSTLLYIEDSPANVSLMRAAIRHRPLWTLAHAENGVDGLRMAGEISPAAILLDLHLPDIDGTQVLRQLRSSGAGSIPVAILSADANPTQVTSTLEAGADCYLTKPVDLGALFAFLDGICELGTAPAH
jgi:CheY-like chemotaxis protein